MKSRLFSALKKSLRRQKSQHRREAGWRRRPTLETLEDRCLLAASPPLINSIEGINLDQNSYNSGATVLEPPDPHGAIGPNHVLDVVNVSIQWFKKPTVAGGPATPQVQESLNNFFAPLNPVPNGIIFDPKALYDPYAGRFLVTSLEVSDTSAGGALNMSRILLAVSDDNDPNGTWYYKSINSTVNVSTTTIVNGVSTTVTVPYWTDYPGFALDKGAIYVTGNLFGFGAAGLPNGNRLWIVDKGLGQGGFYDGGPARMVWDTSSGAQQPWDVTKYTSLTLKLGTVAAAPKFRNLQPAVVLANKADGSDTSLGTWLSAYDGDTDGTNEYVSVIRVDNPLVTPKFTLARINVGNLEAPNLANVNGPGVFPVAGAPQLGSVSLIDVNDRRALSAVWRNNSLYLTTEIYPQTGDDINQITAHWFRFNTSAANLATVTLADQGNVGGEELGFAAYTYMPSVAVDYQDNMVIGFAASGPTLYPGAYYALRAKTDTAGTIRDAGVLAAGVDAYALGGSPSRWGDYTFVGVDPTDQVTFWAFNEYALAGQAYGGRWGTRWGSFSFATPATATPTSPTTLSGVVYDDSADEDGVWQAELGELPLANRQVYLDLDKDGYYDLTEPSVTTDDSGAFTLDYTLTAGTYFLQEALPQGWHLTQPALPATYYTITVATNGTLTVSPAGTVTGQTVSLNFGNSNKNGFNWGTAPAPYPTLAVDNGASHVVVTGFGLGPAPSVTGGSDGVPTVDADGDGDGGVVLDPTTPLSPGKTSKFKVTVSTGGRPVGRFYGWIDFNRDGDWADPGEEVFGGSILGAGVTTLNVAVPATATPGVTYARFRYAAAADINLSYAGPASAGEVEDYKLQILSAVPIANPDAFTVDQNSVNNSLDVLTNDIPSAAGRQALKITSVSGAAGTVTVNDNGTPNDYTDDTLTYTPATGSLATDVFVYTITDMTNPNPSTNSSSTTVTVTINVPILPVTAVDDSFTLTTTTGSVNLDVLKNDFSGPTGSISIASLIPSGEFGAPTAGTITVVTSGSKQFVRYTAPAGFTGAATDQFTYTVIDAVGSTGMATVTVHALHAVPPAIQNDLVKFSLVATDTNGVALPLVNGRPQIGQGQLFQMQVYVQDMRNQPGYPVMDPSLDSTKQGVYSAYADLLYDRSLVAFNGTASFGSMFDTTPPSPKPGQNYNASTPGLIDEFGAFQGSSPPKYPTQPQLLFSATYRANTLGTAEFKTDPADVLSHEVVLNTPSNVPVPYTGVEYGTVLVDVIQLTDLVKIRLQPIDAAGNTVSQLAAGQEFWVQAWVSDLRPQPQGVYSAYLNISYDASLAAPVKVPVTTNPLGFDITWGSLFTDAAGNGVNRSGSVAAAGFVAEVGATQVSISGVKFTNEQRLFKVHFIAQSTAAGGSLVFNATPATNLPVHEVTIFPQDSVPPIQVDYVSTSPINIPGAAGEGEYTNPANPFDVTGDGFVSPVDALILVNFLNQFGTSNLPAAEGEAAPHYYFDVNRDRTVSAADVLSVINCLNNAASGEGEAAHSDIFAVASPVAPLVPGAVGRTATVTPVASTDAAGGTSPSQSTADPATGASDVNQESWLGRLAADQADLDALLSDGFAMDILGGWAKLGS